MKTDKKPYDTAFKDLAAQEPAALLRLVGAIPPGATVKPLPREVSAPMLAADQPYEVISATEHFVAHIEEQTRWDDAMPLREVAYEAIFWVNYRLPVRSYVLVLTPAGFPDDAPTSATIEAGDLTLTARFTIVKLWELAATTALAMNSESLLPFVPLMRGGQAELEQTARRLQQIADEKRQRELALHFVALGGLRYNRDDLLDLMGRLTVIPLHILRETPFYQDILEEGREEGREEVRKEVGRTAIFSILRRLITKRFPGFVLDLEAEQVSDPAKLEQLCVDFDELPDEAALQARLTELTIKH